ERRALEEDAAREGLGLLRGCHRGLTPVGGDGRRTFGRRLGLSGVRLEADVAATVAARDVANPEKAEDNGETRTGPACGPADDQADEDADDADGEPDRPKARWRLVRFLLARLGLHLERLPSPAHLVGFNRLCSPLVNDVTTAATAAKYDASRRSSRRVRSRFRTRPSGGRRARGSHRSFRSPPATASFLRRSPWRWRRCRACRRRTGASARGRGGRAAPR